jgi:hypothetical protein
MRSFFSKDKYKSGSLIAGSPAPTMYSSAWQSVKTLQASPSGALESVDKLIVDDLLFSQASDYPIAYRDYGLLAQDASQKANANQVNMIAFLKDIRRPKEMIPKLRNLKKLKSLANDYLTVNYGLLPTISDIEGIVGAFKKLKPYMDKNGFKTYSAGYSDSLVKDNISYSIEQHIKLAISDNDSGIIELMNKLESLGVYPTLVNIWDLVPYSFVIDWLVDVGGFLERIDTCLRLMRFDIKYVTSSHKMITSKDLLPSDTFPYIGRISQVRYHRWVSDQCPVPPLSVETTFLDFDHWLESTALLLQRKKH